MLALRFLCLLALGTSTALLIDYMSPEPSFCGLESGCGNVRRSGFGYLPIPGVGQAPVPVFGVLAFGLLYVSTLQRTAHLRRQLVTPLAYAGGLVALILLGLQGFIGSFCSLCVVTDLSAILGAVCVFQLRDRGWDNAQSEEDSRSTLMDLEELLSEGARVKGVWRDDSQVYDAPNPLVRPAPTHPFRLKFSTWVFLGAFAVLCPLLFPQLVRTTEIPSSISALYEPGKVTVVEFFDFECPHCQDLSPRLKKIVEKESSLSLRFGYTPLPQHEGARASAEVAICAAEQNQELETVEALLLERAFEQEKAREVARQLVADGAAFDACLASPRPGARIEADTNALKAAGFEGLPTTYVGASRILGARDDAVYLDAIRRAKDGSDRSGLNPYAFWGAMLALFAVILMTGRIPAGDRRSIPGVEKERRG